MVANHNPMLAGSCVEETSKQTATFPVSFSLSLSPQQASNSAAAYHVEARYFGSFEC